MSGAARLSAGRWRHLQSELVLDALNMALGQRRPRPVIYYSDQNLPRRRPGVAGIPRWLYTSLAFGRRCKKAGVRPAMGSVGDAGACPRAGKPDPGDNALGESFFATLECHLLERCRFASQLAARMACFSFIEGFYNPTRRHSALGYRSPIRCEEKRQPDRQSPSP
jgi:putative transposase